MLQAVEFSNVTPTLGDLEKAGITIFNDWWNTYIPDYKNVLIKKIIHAYHFYQIGSETPDRFVYNINSHLEQIMPYYNQLYASELLKFDPLLNHSIETNGRKIENILSKANTSDDRFSKAIRDFAGVTDRSGETNGTAIGKVTNVSTADENSKYNKDGTEHTDDFNVEDKTNKVDKNTSGHMSQNKTDTNSEISSTSETRELTKDVTETPNEKTVKEMKWGATENGTKDVTGNVKGEGNGTKDWTETRDDDATTDTTTNLKESTSGSGEKDYADTPQTELEVDDKTGTSRVRKDYLTNVTWTSESSSHNADTTQKQTYADDETKTHKETTSDKTTTDSTEKTTSSNTKGGTDTETDTHTGTNTENTTENETTTGNANKNVNDTENTTQDTRGEEHENSTGHQTDDRDIDKAWKENGTAEENQHTTSTTDSTNDTKENTSGTEQTKETSDIVQNSTNTNIKETEETTDEGTTNIQKGYMNVSASALLEAFRKTFINVDKMIIDELREDFLLVY